MNPSDPVDALKETLTRATQGENLVPLFIDGAIVLILSACTFSLLTGPLLLGYTEMCVRIQRGETVAVGDSLKHLSPRFGQGVVLWLLWLLAHALGGLALGAGALVANFFLAYLFVVVVTTPGISAVDAVKESVRRALAHPMETAVLTAVALGLHALLGATGIGLAASLAFSTLLRAVMARRLSPAVA